MIRVCDSGGYLVSWVGGCILEEVTQGDASDVSRRCRFLAIRSHRQVHASGMPPPNPLKNDPPKPPWGCILGAFAQSVSIVATSRRPIAPVGTGPLVRPSFHAIIENNYLNSAFKWNNRADRGFVSDFVGFVNPNVEE